MTCVEDQEVHHHHQQRYLKQRRHLLQHRGVRLAGIVVASAQALLA
jgi:glutamine phosphoribosylpyrophosphate amidotransferase